MIVSGKEVLGRANRQNYAVGAFNVSNMEQVQAVIAAAEQKKASVFIQISEAAINYAGLYCLTSLVLNLAERSFVPVVFHLDHGTSYDAIIQCIRCGLTSVMIDASAFPFAENVKMTQDVVKVAHACGVAVEAMLGAFSVPLAAESNGNSGEPDSSVGEYADPAGAAQFVSETGVDALAITMGNKGNEHAQEPSLFFQKLKEIKEKIKIPLVLHGASGVSDADLRSAVVHGVNKVNMDTELQQACFDGCRGVLRPGGEGIWDVRKLFGAARSRMTEVVKEKIGVLGTGA
ncbi:MAG: class II fructose-bisphosphate aldolase family protein [Oscillospiraceae bacterium]|nr:class II fructose-bisphosphate aldolase family protein [Oscillospiraceae bacterium]